jgi:general secretion pathway protein M
MDKLKVRFLQLSDRERRLMIVSACVLIVAIFYWGIWSPMTQSVERGQNTLSNQRSLLAWVQKNANRAAQLRSSVTTNSNFSGALPQAVNKAASAMNIAISRMQPQGQELQIWVDQAPFNDVLAWLQALESAGIQIIDLDMIQTDVPGQVKIRRLKLAKS